MPKVVVTQAIEGKKSDVYHAVKSYLTGRDTLKKIGAEMQWDDKSCGGQIEADSFSGEIAVEEKGKTAHVTITIDLPLLLSPFKGKVEEELKKHLGRVKV
jgi:hypothetical protein